MLRSAYITVLFRRTRRLGLPGDAHESGGDDAVDNESSASPHLNLQDALVTISVPCRPVFEVGTTVGTEAEVGN